MNIISRLLFGLALSLATAAVMAEPIDINTATAEEIASVMVGVGKAKADAIVQDREKNGHFNSIDELARIKGIKTAIINKNRDKVTVGATAPAAPKPANAPPKAPGTKG